MAVAFNGVTLIAPGVASYIDDNNASVPAQPSTNPEMVIMGTAVRGETTKALAFSNFNTALAYYGDASTTNPLVYGMLKAFSAGARRVIGLRVGNATRATAKVQGNTADLFTLSANEYGYYGNSWSLKVSAASSGKLNNKKITFTRDNGSTYIQDNIGQDYLKLEYINDDVTTLASLNYTSIIAKVAIASRTMTLSAASGYPLTPLTQAATSINPASTGTYTILYNPAQNPFTKSATVGAVTATSSLAVLTANTATVAKPTTGVAASTIAGTVLTLGSSSTDFPVGVFISGTGVAEGTKIVSGSGSAYVVNISQYVASTTITPNGVITVASGANFSASYIGGQITLGANSPVTIGGIGTDSNAAITKAFILESTASAITSAVTYSISYGPWTYSLTGQTVPAASQATSNTTTDTQFINKTTVLTVTPKTIASINGATNYFTVVTSSAHGLSVGSKVTITGVGTTTPAYNGTWIVATAADATTFTVTTNVASFGAAAVSGATCTPLSALGATTTVTGVSTGYVVSVRAEAPNLLTSDYTVKPVAGTQLTTFTTAYVTDFRDVNNNTGQSQTSGPIGSSTAPITAAGVGGAAVTYTPVAIPIASSSLTLPFNQYPTLGALINKINSSQVLGRGWKASLAPGTTDPGILSTNFDNLAETNVTTSSGVVFAGLSNTILSGHVFAFYQTLLSDLYSPHFSVARNYEELQSNIIRNAARIDDGVYGFSGGTEDQVSATHWANALEELENSEQVEIICPMTNDTVLQTAVLEHCRNMSGPTGKKERFAVFGGTLNQTIQQAKTLAATFNDKRAIVVWPGIKDYDIDGNLVTWAPMYLAPTIAAMLYSQVDPATPLTLKGVNLIGLEKIAKPSDIDDLISGGVLAVKYEPSRGFVIAQSLTTWTGDLRYVRREISTMRCADIVMKRVRSSIAGFAGSRISSTLISDIRRHVDTVLAYSQDAGLIAGASGLPAYKDVNIRVVGDSVYVDFSISPSIPANYILITAHIL